ncbi:MAG: zf-HC2 domain-containing protein [Planctomycetota bacterium]
MSCPSSEQAFAARFDETLTPAEAARFDQHLDGCASCHASYADYRTAIGALRSTPPRRTSPELKRNILAGVAAAAAAGQTPRHLVWGRVLARAASLAAAALLGAVLTAAWFWPTRSEPAIEPAAPQVVERIVEVERPVEVTRWVEVERLVPMERVVERVVERTVPIERVVRRGPWLSWDAAPVARALRGLTKGLEAAAGAYRDVHLAVRADLAAAEAREARRPGPAAEPMGAPTAPPTAPPARLGQWRDPVARASVQIRKTKDGTIRLQLRGTLDEVVPMLLAELGHADPEVAALVERRLSDFAARVAADPKVGPRVVDPTAVAAATPVRRAREAERELDDPPPPAERWTAWWAANAELVVAAAPRLDL